MRRRIRRRSEIAATLVAWLAVSSPPPADCFLLVAPISGNQVLHHDRHQALLSQQSTLLYASTPILQDLPVEGSRRRATPAASPPTLASTSNSKIPLDRQIVNLGRKGKIDVALDLLQSIAQPTIRQVNAAMDACGRAKPVRLETALQLLHQYCRVNQANANATSTTTISSSSSSLQRLQPNVYTFGALMSVCARAKNVNQAMRLFEVMQSCNVTPNGVVYNAAISACASCRQPQLAMELLQQAKHQNVSLSVVGYNAAIYAAAEDCTMALHLLNHMRTHGPAPDAVTYGTVLAALEKSQQWQLVVNMAKEMKHDGFAWDGLVVTSVLHACQKLGLWQDALSYLQLMKTVGTYERKTAGLEIAGHKQPLQGPDAVAYRLVISACAKGGAWKEGIKLLKEYCDIFDGGDVMAYTSAIIGCKNEGQWVQAFRLLERMRQSNIQPNEVTFAATIYACATATAKLLSSGAFIYSPDDDDASLRPDPHLKAMKLLNVLKKDSTVPNPNVQVYNAAIRSCAEAWDIDRAFLLFDEIITDGLEPTIMTYGELMTACERKGDTGRASRVFKLMRERNVAPNEIIYGAAISCCRKAGESERALLLLKKMMRESLAPNVAVFNTVLMAQAEAKSAIVSPEESMERAMTVYKILSSSEYSAAKPNRQTYNILVRTMAAKGDPKQAEFFLRQMRSDGFVPDVDLYTATVSSFERRGQPLKALRIMESMREDGYDFYEFPVLNSAFKKAVRLVNAVGRGLSSTDGDEKND
ncbi:hypothetical protein MPSEU_000121100 [Mayamaea pseudoterrestris]|nr:hypothetical protein MPSEU_000121100 [Mayamaea pseudoterrestris]